MASLATGLVLLALPCGDAAAQGMSRKAGETTQQCMKRHFPKGYNAKNLQHCVKACYHCHTTSGGSRCESYCKGIGAT